MPRLQLSRTPLLHAGGVRLNHRNRYWGRFFFLSFAHCASPERQATTRIKLRAGRGPIRPLLCHVNGSIKRAERDLVKRREGQSKPPIGRAVLLGGGGVYQRRLSGGLKVRHGRGGCGRGPGWRQRLEGRHRARPVRRLRHAFLDARGVYAEARAAVCAATSDGRVLLRCAFAARECKRLGGRRLLQRRLCDHPLVVRLVPSPPAQCQREHHQRSEAERGGDGAGCGRKGRLRRSGRSAGVGCTCALCVSNVRRGRRRLGRRCRTRRCACRGRARRARLRRQQRGNGGR